MWHCPHVVGSRASSTDATCRAWQFVQVPKLPSAFGRPTLWHASQPFATAAAPSSGTSEFAARRIQPGW